MIFGYTGRERDSESDLQYNRNRYYDAATGRWISEDPKGFAAGDSNLNRYVGNSSTNATDPSGLVDPSVEYGRRVPTAEDRAWDFLYKHLPAYFKEHPHLVRPKNGLTYGEFIKNQKKWKTRLGENYRLAALALLYRDLGYAIKEELLKGSIRCSKYPYNSVIFAGARLNVMRMGQADQLVLLRELVRMEFEELAQERRKATRFHRDIAWWAAQSDPRPLRHHGIQRGPLAPEELRVLGDALEAGHEVAQYVFEPYDWVLLTTEVIADPSNSQYAAAALLPFVTTSSVRKLKKACSGSTPTDRLKEQLFERAGKNKRLHSTLRGAMDELAGKTTGFDHVTKVRNAQRGLVNRIQQITRELASPSLTDTQRQALQRELSEASKLLDLSKMFVP